MKIFFLDQSGTPGGAELCLMDIAQSLPDEVFVCLLQDGPFRQMLEERQIPVMAIAQTGLNIRKEGSLFQALLGAARLPPLIHRVAQLSKSYDVIYANTQKALVVGAFASWLNGRPLVFHLHDILTLEHFSSTNLKVAIAIANRFARRVIANSQAAEQAFVAAGGRVDLVEVIYNGFDLSHYCVSSESADELRQQLGLSDKFVVGHFSRLSPWKGQHVLIDAIQQCPENVVALLVGDALFGEDDYAQQLKAQVQQLGLQDRVHFLGFRADIPQLMSACDLVAHTSTAPEPFGRVIVEAMLCGTPVIAANAGGAAEIVEHGLTGWLCEPGDSGQLAETIRAAHADPALCQQFAEAAQAHAQARFSLEQTNRQIHQLLEQVVG